MMMIMISLKEKQAVESTKNIETPSQLGQLQGTLTCQIPNKELNVFQGVLSIAENTIANPPSSRPSSMKLTTTLSGQDSSEMTEDHGTSIAVSTIPTTSTTSTAGPIPPSSISEIINECPVDSQNLLLRGSILKNSNWVTCMVVYTGRLTKLSLNMNQSKFKFSGIETSLNEFVPKVLFLQLALTLV